MRRALRIGAGLGLALVIITCTETTVTGPKRPGLAALNMSAWAARVAGTPPVPIDSLEIILRRPADQSVALDQILGFRTDTLKGDSAIIQVNVALAQSPETFDIVVRAFGGGSDWYHFTGSVQVTAGAAAAPAVLAGQYVGPGATATRVQMLPADTTAVGGTLVALHAKVTDAAGTAIPGVPIGYRLGDSTRGKVAYPTPFSATLTAALSIRDSVWVVAETPTHLKDSTRVHLLPQPVQLLKVSGDNQTGVLGAALHAPFLVRVVDALGTGFKGDSVRWVLAAGSGTLSAAATATDDSGYARVTLTPTTIGALTVQAAATAISGSISGSPASFSAAAGTGNVKKVVISPKVDTLAYGATLQYAATLYDSLGNVVTSTVLWNSTVGSVAAVTGSGLASAVGGDSTKIIASSGGYADTARLYVRVLRTLSVAPADTVITAVGDSVRLRTAGTDNFGAPVTTGLRIRFVSASALVVKVDTTGKAKIIGPGNGVVLAIDTVAPTIVVQGSSTLRVNQVIAGIVNNPKDSVVVGVSGQTQVVATGVDSNGFAIPGTSFGWVTRPLAGTGGPIATVTNTGLVSGVALGFTYAVDTVVRGLTVFKDSTKVVVSTSPPALLQWGFDSTAVGNGGNLSVGLAVTTPPAATLTVTIASSDTTIAKASPNTVTIPAGASATSVTILGLKAGRDTLTANAPGYTSKRMIVGVVSTITLRETANPCCQQQYFYLNQNETHSAQVWLSDPAPPGGVGITFVYGHGLTAVTPSPAVIPAGQLSANIVLQGLTPGTGGQPDSVVPTSGGYIGKFSYVYVAPDSLRLNLPYPYNGVLGVGQQFQPYVSLSYAMDHPLVVAAQLSPARGTTASLDTIRTGTTYQYLTVTAKSPGKDTLTLAASGWVSARSVLTFSTPHLGVSGTTQMVAGTPSPGHGSWTVYAEDSLRINHIAADTVRATLVSRDTTIVAVDSTTVSIVPGGSSAGVNNALRAQPGAGGKSVWLVASSNSPDGYSADSFQLNVLSPTLTLLLGYPYDGRVAVGTSFQNAGYVTIPYARPDTFWVVFGHTNKSAVAGPDSVAVVKGQTFAYFNTQGVTVNATDTMTVTRATGYVIPSPVVFRVDSIHVRPSSYPSSLFTISPPQGVYAYAYDAVNFQARPLVAPLTVALTSSKPGTFTLDSSTVTIPAALFPQTGPDTLRVKGADTVGAFIRTSASGSTPDSVGPIKVAPTPLTVNFGYPYNGYVGRGFKLQNNLVTLPAAAQNTVTVVLQRYNPLKDSLTATSVLIPKGTNVSQPFDIFGLDSTGTDSLTATALGFVTSRQTVHDTAAALSLQGLGTSHLTTEPAQNVSVYTRMRTGYYQNVITLDTVGLKSSDSTVIRIDSTFVRGDSAVATIPAGQGTGVFKISYVGSGSARLRVSARGFDSDSSPLISVTGPSLNLVYTTVTTGLNQIFGSEFVYVDNVVTGTPLVVTLQRSDSNAVNPIFGLSTTSVTIPVGTTSSPVFNITGQNVNAAQLIARAPGYNQAVASVSVGQPRLAPSTTTLSLYVGAPPIPLTQYTEDQTGAARVVASAITISDASTAPTVAVADSATFSVPAQTYIGSVGVRGLMTGSTALIFSSPTYKSDTVQVSVDTAQLVLSPGAIVGKAGGTAQMYVVIPFTTSADVTVALSSSNPAVLTVPASVTIPASSSIGYFTVTGGTAGSVSVGATATGFRPATPVGVTVQ